MRMSALVGVLLWLAGCTSAQIVERKMSDNDLLRGKPQAYLEGWSDGCHSAVYESREWMKKEGDEFKRDEARMAKDVQYQFGWSDGMRNCYLQTGGSSFIYMPRK